MADLKAQGFYGSIKFHVKLCYCKKPMPIFTFFSFSGDVNILNNVKATSKLVAVDVEVIIFLSTTMF